MERWFLHGQRVKPWKALCIRYTMAVLRVVPRPLKCYFLLQWPRMVGAPLYHFGRNTSAIDGVCVYSAGG